jgi:hypothetical protein
VSCMKCDFGLTCPDCGRWVADLYSEVSRLRAALEIIQEGRGPFSMDQLTFATNVIEAMKETARAALAVQALAEKARS